LKHCCITTIESDKLKLDVVACLVTKDFKTKKAVLLYLTVRHSKGTDLMKEIHRTNHRSVWWLPDGSVVCVLISV